MYSAIEFLGDMSIIFIIVAFFVILCGMLDDEQIYKKPAYITILVIVIALTIISVMCLGAVINHNEVDYSTVVARQAIDSVEIDPEQDRVTWSIGKGNYYYEDAEKCRFVVVGPDMYSVPNLPYYEWHKEVKNSTLHIFGKTYYRASTIKDYHVFYIPRAYTKNLPNSSIDWDRMFEPW